MYCTQNANILLWCDIEHVKILLLLLFHFIIIGIHFYHGVNISLMGTPLNTGVNLVHFKGAHCEPYDTLIWDCFLEESTLTLTEWQ